MCSLLSTFFHLPREEIEFRKKEEEQELILYIDTLNVISQEIHIHNEIRRIYFRTSTKRQRESNVLFRHLPSVINRSILNLLISPMRWKYWNSK